MGDEVRGGFIVMLVKHKLQGPSLARPPSEALEEAIVMCSHAHMFLKNLQE